MNLITIRHLATAPLIGKYDNSDILISFQLYPFYSSFRSQRFSGEFNSVAAAMTTTTNTSSINNIINNNNNNTINNNLSNNNKTLENTSTDMDDIYRYNSNFSYNQYDDAYETSDKYETVRSTYDNYEYFGSKQPIRDSINSSTAIDQSYESSSIAQPSLFDSTALATKKLPASTITTTMTTSTMDTPSGLAHDDSSLWWNGKRTAQPVLWVSNQLFPFQFCRTIELHAALNERFKPKCVFTEWHACDHHIGEPK